MKKISSLQINIKWIALTVLLLSALSVIGQLPPELLEKQVPKKQLADSIFFSFSMTHFTLKFFIRMVINLVSMTLLIRFIYYRVYRRHEHVFTFFMFNLVIFIITILLNADDGFSIGAAFGLFAIFSMMRYRTENVSATDMTYLFMSITFGLISAINQGSWLEIIMINGVILLAAYLIEGNILFKPEFVKSIEYENIELVKPGKNDELIADLKSRTGLHIHKVYVKRIDYLRDMAELKVYYHSPDNRDV
jgi:hypothetical protein